MVVKLLEGRNRDRDYGIMLPAGPLQRSKRRAMVPRVLQVVLQALAYAMPPASPAETSRESRGTSQQLHEPIRTSIKSRRRTGRMIERGGRKARA